MISDNQRPLNLQERIAKAIKGMREATSTTQLDMYYSATAVMLKTAVNELPPEDTSRLVGEWTKAYNESSAWR